MNSQAKVDRLNDRIAELEDELAAANRRINDTDPGEYVVAEVWSMIHALLSGRKVIVPERNLNDGSVAYYFVTDASDFNTKD